MSMDTSRRDKICEMNRTAGELLVQCGLRLHQYRWKPTTFRCEVDVDKTDYQFVAFLIIGTVGFLIALSIVVPVCVKVGLIVWRMLGE